MSEYFIKGEKNMKVLRVVAVLLFIVAGIMLYKGYDKMTNYTNSDSYYVKNHNAYVGGDAYNYIINGTYSTAFFVLGAGSAISAFICIGISMIIGTLEKKTSDKVQLETVSSNELPPL